MKARRKILSWNKTLRTEAGLTCGEVDVGKKDDVCGDERDELSDADLLFKVDVNHVVISQAAVG